MLAAQNINGSHTRLLQARNVMETNGVVPANMLRPAIADSWRRCLAAGLNPRQPPRPDRLSAIELQRHRETHAPIRSLALLEMQSLHQQLGINAFVLALAAPDGVLLDSVMAETHRAQIEAFGIVPGSYWHEDRLGTNALGTAIAAKTRVDVRGAEHFFAEHNGLSCMTAPIFAPDRSLAGVLDASCPAGAYAPHTRAVLALSAAQIEAQLFRISLPGNRILTLHGREEFLNTAYAGMLMLDEADRVIAANEQSRFMLAGLPDPAGAPLAALFASGAPMMRPGIAAPLTDRIGRMFYARFDGGRNEPVPQKAASRLATHKSTIADDPAVAIALDMADRAAQRSLPVLIRGETGTGKEVVARAAHAASGRTGKFIAVNCAAIPPDLLAAELFGHAEGAYTGARRGGARGLALEADGGTLFLDEIADIPGNVQAALLRFLDDFSVRQVGGTSSRVVDTLLLAATNANLAACVTAGQFRADLYYRLAVTEVFLPRLAARKDIPALARALLHAISPAARLSDAAMARLECHDWPGNIRELRNLLTKLSVTGPLVIDADAVNELLSHHQTIATPGGSALQDAHWRQVDAAMRQAGGNISSTARSLGVSRNTIYRALRRDTSAPPA